jgi:hypothetical protein
MLNLNLLPPQEKFALRYMVRRRVVLALGMSVIAVLLLFEILLLPTVLLLVFQEVEAVRAVDGEVETQKRLGLIEEEQRLRSIVRIAESTEEALRQQERLSPVFIAAMRAVPQGVVLSGLRYRVESRELLVEGFAPTRAALLAYTVALQQETVFSGAQAPVSNLVRETNISFSVVATRR